MDLMNRLSRKALANAVKATKPQATQAQGVYYIASTKLVNKDSDITAVKLYNLEENVYNAGVYNKFQNLILTDL
jgi:hypothetical protein